MAPGSDTYHHANLRQALLGEAAFVLEREGADAISFRALARALDVSHAAPGHHFADRHELLAELAADGYRGLADALAAAMEGVPPEAWLRRAGEAYIGFGLANPERYRMMFASRLMSEECPDRLGNESTRAYLLLLQAAHQRPPSDDPALYRVQTPELAAWSMVHGAVMLWLDGQLGESLDRGEFERLTTEMLGTHFG
jgi:AcrR family transcriptional regulator